MRSIFDIENNEPIKNIKGYEIKDMGILDGDETIIHIFKLPYSIINRENFEELINISRVVGIKKFEFDDVIIDIDKSMDFLNMEICSKTLSINNNLNVSNLNIKSDDINIRKTTKFTNCNIECNHLRMYEHKIPKFINCKVNCIFYNLFINQQLEHKIFNEFKEKQLEKEFDLNNIPPLGDSILEIDVVEKSNFIRYYLMTNKSSNIRFDNSGSKIIGKWEIRS